MPKYTNTKTGQVFNSPKPLSADQLEELFSTAAPKDTVESAQTPTQTDVEQIRRQNLQNAFAQTQPQTALGQLQRTAGYINRGDYGAVLPSVGNAAITGAMEPVNAGLNALSGMGGVGNFIGEGLRGVANIPGQIVSGGSSLIGSGLRSLGVPESVMNLGMTPQAEQENSNLLNNVAQAYLAPILAKGAMSTAESVGSGLKTLAPILEKKAITPPFDKNRGLEVIDRQINTALKNNYSPSRAGIAKLQNDLDLATAKSKALSSASAQAGTTIDFGETVKFLDDKLAKAKKSSAQYNEIKSAIDDVKDRLNQISTQHPDGQVPIDIANDVKSSFQDMATGNYDRELPPSKTQIKMYKDVGHQLLNQIITKEPDLRNIGLRQRDLIELKPILERKVNATEKTLPFNWQTVRKVGIASGIGAASGSPIAGLGAFAAEEALTNPKGLHQIARGSNALGDALQFPQVGGKMLPGGLGTPQSFKSMVENAGGKYVGIQKTTNGEPLILFNDKNGSTLAIRQSELTPANILAKMAESNAKFNK